MSANIEKSALSLQALLISEFYGAEISGEAAFARLEELVTDEHQARACALLEKLEAVTAQALAPLLVRYGVQRDEETDRRRGEGWTLGYASSPDWKSFWVGFIPVTEAWLGGMQFLQAICEEDDRSAVGQLVAHEVALLEFAQREVSGAINSTEPLEQHLAAYSVSETR